MDGVEDPTLVQGIPDNFVEGARSERETAGAQSEQTPPFVEFENQIRRIPGEYTAADLGIAQFSGLLGDLLSKFAEFVDELRSGFLLVAAQRVPSQWKTSRSAPTMTPLILGYKPPRRAVTRGILDPRPFS
jgi:hypothetical protein